MVTDVQDSCYELVADNDYNNMHTIFRNISDIKLYKPYQHPQRYHPHPTRSRHIYSSLNNTPANPTFDDTASQFGPDHSSYNKTATTPISRPPNTNTQRTREKEVDIISGTLHYLQNMLTSSLIYEGDKSKTQIRI